MDWSSILAHGGNPVVKHQFFISARILSPAADLLVIIEEKWDDKACQSPQEVAWKTLTGCLLTCVAHCCGRRPVVCLILEGLALLDAGEHDGFDVSLTIKFAI
jgi:hypothetical protein